MDKNEECILAHLVEVDTKSAKTLVVVYVNRDFADLLAGILIEYYNTPLLFEPASISFDYDCGLVYVPDGEHLAIADTRTLPAAIASNPKEVSILSGFAPDYALAFVNADLYLPDARELASNAFDVSLGQSPTDAMLTIPVFDEDNDTAFHAFSIRVLDVLLHYNIAVSTLEAIHGKRK